MTDRSKAYKYASAAGKSDQEKNKYESLQQEGNLEKREDGTFQNLFSFEKYC